MIIGEFMYYAPLSARPAAARRGSLTRFFISADVGAICDSSSSIFMLSHAGLTVDKA
jgi:hypothetical protein